MAGEGAAAEALDRAEKGTTEDQKMQDQSKE